MRTFILANIFDVLSTLVGIAVGGIEINPIISLVMEATSVPQALLVKLAIAMGIGLLINRWKPHLLSIPTMALAVIAISNSLVALGYI